MSTTTTAVASTTTTSHTQADSPAICGADPRPVSSVRSTSTPPRSWSSACPEGAAGDASPVPSGCGGITGGGVGCASRGHRSGPAGAALPPAGRFAPRPSLLVVVLLDIHGPNVVMSSVANVLHGQHRGEH